VRAHPKEWGGGIILYMFFFLNMCTFSLPQFYDLFYDLLWKQDLKIEQLLTLVYLDDKYMITYME
jgi:hypothetical protein